MTRERVLITGGAAGIGAACARRCEADGLEPVVIDRVGDGLVADLSDPEATAGALEKALAGGPITRLINNVGVVVPSSAGEQTLEELELAWSLNVRCAMQCMQGVVARHAGGGIRTHRQYVLACGARQGAAHSVFRDEGRPGRHDAAYGRSSSAVMASRRTRSGPVQSARNCSTARIHLTARVRERSSRACR